MRPHSPVETDAILPGLSGPGVQRGRVDHVIILDGTMASLDPGFETNAGRAYYLMREAVPGARRRVYYEPGIQWEGWRRVMDVIQGRGINRQIRRAYGWLSSHYREGDRIFLIGYSRGAYAVRSLAGVIDRIGLLRHEFATERNVTMAYRHYQLSPDSRAAKAFTYAHCHLESPIEMVGVWDTVKALGLRVPLIWLFTDHDQAFHNHHLGNSVKHGFHALALDETRAVFDPVMWECPPDWHGNVEQVWFRGAHGDVGGQIGDTEEARPLANIPFVWMMERAETCGLPLPEGWRGRFPQDADAPMVGTWRAFGKLFLFRHRRAIGLDSSERLHPSVKGEAARRWPAAAEAQGIGGRGPDVSPDAGPPHPGAGHATAAK